jgi:signal transduction histidine kinase
MNGLGLTGTSGTVSFEPRARLMRLIGGELVSDEVAAVTELVKNAYDADARVVKLTFNNVASGNGEIVISDDGIGMTLQDIADYWMQPGGTTKSGERFRKSRGGRRVLGEKGIGRFAVDKLGTGLSLTTRKAGQRQEVQCVFDWRDFEHETRMLSDVACTWELRPSATIAKRGTVLTISGLRTSWTERLFRKLCVRLGRLKTPFHDADDDFRVMVESDDFPDYAGELSVDYLDRAPHHVTAQFDGIQTVVLEGARDREVLTWNGDGQLECGPVRLRLYAFDLETQAITKLGPARDVRGWLREWTGVSIYRDGFRLAPYGEPNDDWLRLDQRRVNNPVVRISNNQIIGFIEITRQLNPELIDQTNREGMIANKAFADLRRLVLFVMQQLESARQEARHPVESIATSAHLDVPSHQSLSDELDELGAGGKAVSAAKFKVVARKLRENSEHEQRRARTLADGYAELAAIGQVAEDVSRRASAIVTLLDREISSLPAGTSKIMGSLQRHIAALKETMVVLDPIQSHHGARRRALDLRQELERSTQIFAGRLEERGIVLELPESNTLVRLEMRPENLQRVLAVLFSNSLAWLHRVTSPRIRISVEPNASERLCALVFADNGPGIPASIAARAFEPMESGREGARGMGLTIARSIVESVGGTITIVQDGRRKGASIRVLLPQKRTRALRRR